MLSILATWSWDSQVSLVASDHVGSSADLSRSSLCPPQEREQMQRYNQRMLEQLKVRQQQEKARLPKIQRSEGKTRMAMYKKSLHINGGGSAAEQRDKIKQVGLGPAQRGRA